MKKIVAKLPPLTIKLSATAKAGTHALNAQIKSVNADKLMETPDNKTTNTGFSKMMDEYLRRKHLKFI